MSIAETACGVEKLTSSRSVSSSKNNSSCESDESVVSTRVCWVVCGLTLLRSNRSVSTDGGTDAPSAMFNVDSEAVETSRLGLLTSPVPNKLA